ncbi:MAG: DUF4127 family protein [Schwartzia sp. (in: firmicutes)]
MRPVPQRSLILFLTVAALLLVLAPFAMRPRGVPLAVSPKIERRVLLLPLDSRPPCLDFVSDLGRIAGVEIVAPPEELLDYYTKPGDTAALKAWTKENIVGCDYAIVSVDQLLHGGLLASREDQKTPADDDTLLSFLRDLHESHPAIPLYAFHILPRLTPPDSISGYEERKALMAYSRLTDQIDLQTIPAADDIAEQQALQATIPAESLDRYEKLFEHNARLNRALIDLAADGTLTRLIIGQDDGERYGIPNRERRRLLDYLRQRRIDDNHVFFTHGADEIAQTLLAAVEAERDGFVPRVAIRYNDPATPWRHLPYMAADMETSAKEKIRLLGGIEVSDPEKADFILYLSAHDTATLGSRRAAADEVKTLVSKGRAVALVDLSETFTAKETLLPFLVKNDTPLHALAAYAGWNTASNAIGTAAAEATLVALARTRAQTADDLRRLYAAQFQFLDGRFAEDYFYLKDIIDGVNVSLRKAGYLYVNDLDLEHNARWTNDMIQHAMNRRLAAFSATAAFRAPISIPSPGGAIRLAVRRLTAEVWNPWPRTFEIRLRPKSTVEELR